MISRSILVAEDLEMLTDSGARRGQSVRQVAEDFSKLLHEDLQLFYVEENSEDFTWREHHEDSLKQLSEELSVEARPVIRAGRPAEEILKEIHRWPRPEMVIMGTQGTQGFQKFLEGSVAEEVLLNSQRPVMVLGPHSQSQFFKFKKQKPRRILVPTDLTRSSRPAEQYALSLAARLDAELVFFHSVFDHIHRNHTASVVSGFASFDMERIFQKMTRDAKSLLDRKRLRCGRILSSCKYLIAEQGKNISEALLKESSEGYCLIVMGTHSRKNALVRAFLGGTVRETLLKATLPVVVVHSQW